MKRLSFILLTLVTVFSATAQETETDSLNGWKQFGKFSLLFNQAAFNAEWQNGGTSSYGGSALVDYNFNYTNDDFTWDNKIVAEYGATKTDDDEFMRKTVDRVEFNSIAGKQIKESNWYYSLFFNFKTQFAPGYEYSEVDVVDPVTGDVVGIEEVRTETTHAFSPAYLQFGPGLLWKKSDNLKVNIAPATSRLIIVDSEFTSIPGYVDGDYFGVQPGESTRYEFGASLNAYAKFTLLENVSVENMLSLYSNYLEDPQNVDLDYTMSLVMKVNDYLSANFLFQAIYDDNAVKAVQVREVLGVGLTYVFGEEVE
jgi:hypothetical protein